MGMIDDPAILGGMLSHRFKAAEIYSVLDERE